MSQYVIISCVFNKFGFQCQLNDKANAKYEKTIYNMKEKEKYMDGY